MSLGVIVVKARLDPDTKVWFVEWSDLPGLNVEADTLEAFQEQLLLAVADLLDGDDHEGGLDVPIELIAHASSRVRIAA